LKYLVDHATVGHDGLRTQKQQLIFPFMGRSWY
jgi:hypothetical protein